MKLRILKEEREKKNYSQVELAHLLGVKQSAISKWENGDAEPDLEMLKRISDLLKISIDYLLEKKEFEYNINLSTITKLSNEQKTEIIMKILDIISKTENL